MPAIAFEVTRLLATYSQSDAHQQGAAKRAEKSRLVGG